MKKNKLAIVVHGGAGPDSDFIKSHKKEYEEGLKKAVDAGFEVLKNHGSAVDAVEAAVNELENNPIFNAGRGSALNAKGEVEMCASIMNGRNLNSGAVAIVKNVKNPISLAKAIMQNTDYIYLGSEGALDYARSINIALEPESYFVTEHQFDEYKKKRRDAFDSNRDVASEQIKERGHGTVGAVAVDFQGNVAAATSTGGTAYCKEGRIGDSSMIGVGSYADNKTCAVSSTGDGEYLIRAVICHSISSMMKYKKASLKDAMNEIIHKDNKEVMGDLGVIGVDAKGNVFVSYNSERMHHGWRTSGSKTNVKVY